jgi:hypothetical protein
MTICMQRREKKVRGEGVRGKGEGGNLLREAVFVRLLFGVTRRWDLRSESRGSEYCCRTVIFLYFNRARSEKRVGGKGRGGVRGGGVRAWGKGEGTCRTCCLLALSALALFITVMCIAINHF